MPRPRAKLVYSLEFLIAAGLLAAGIIYWLAR
jgi:hypothetical protein